MVCDRWLGSNGYAALKALRRTEWAVADIPERDFIPLAWRSTGARVLSRAIRPIGVNEFNRELLAHVVRHKPEFLLVFKGAFVQAKTLAAIRECGVKNYCFYPDVSFKAHGKYLPQALPYYDWIFTTKRFGIQDLREQLAISNASVLLHAYDADLHREVELSPTDYEHYGCDVSFIGTWSPKKETLVRAIMSELPSVRLRVWGEQWHRATSLRCGAGVIAGYGVSGEEYVRAIAASSINLGMLSERRIGASSGDNITSRTFHIPASGGFMLHERTEELLQIFKEDESVACFGDAQELLAKIAKYLPAVEERRGIACHGRAVVEAGHSWDHRIRDILAHHG